MVFLYAWVIITLIKLVKQTRPCTVNVGVVTMLDLCVPKYSNSKASIRSDFHTVKLKTVAARAKPMVL